MAHAQSWHVLPDHQWRQILPANRKWVSRLCRQHGELAKPLAADYLRELKTGYSFEAENRLRQNARALELGDTGLSATISDKELKQWCEDSAEALAGQCDSLTSQGRVEQAIEHAQRVVNGCGLSFPVEIKGGNPVNETEPVNGVIPFEAVSAEQWGAALARVFDPAWWRRQVRRLQARKIETVAREIRLVSASAGIYASDATCNRHQKQRERNREVLEALEAVNEAGEAVPLAECVDASTSNPVNRRHELMVRMRGFEECAIAAGHDGLFVTITAPSKYHAMNLNRKTQKAYRNPKYNGSTPRDTQQYFCRVWSQIRAQLWREEIRVYGFRIAEPHHDGTPHWHMMLHVEPEKMGRLRAIIDHYALLEDGDEPGAAEQRVKHVEIDPAQGTAAGYIAKYVAKNIDGEHVEGDHYGRDAKQSAKRIEAWASAWGIRQFQQIGGASVTVWRELRRLKFELGENERDRLDGLTGDQQADFLHAWFAADSADWAAYTMMQGGMTVKRDEQLIRSVYREAGKNRYFEEAQRLAGVVVAGVKEFISRGVRWTIQRLGEAAKQWGDPDKRIGGNRAEERGRSAEEWADVFGDRVAVSYGHDGDPARPVVSTSLIGPRSGPTWTCVSNCTA